MQYGLQELLNVEFELIYGVDLIQIAFGNHHSLA